MHVFTNLPCAPSLVLLDLDHTLYDYEPCHRLAMKAVVEKANRLLSLSPDAFEQAFVQARKDVKQRLAAVAAGHSRLLYFQRTIEILGLKTQVLLALDLEQTYWRVFLSNMHLFEGVTDFLQYLRREGIPTVIVSDLTAQVQFRKLVHTGLDGLVDFLVTSEEAGRDKPDLAPYALALEKAQWSSGAIWMIGDDPDKDIRGAKSAIGAFTILRAARRAGDADAIFQHFSALHRFCRTLLPKGPQA